MEASIGIWLLSTQRHSSAFSAACSRTVVETSLLQRVFGLENRILPGFHNGAPLTDLPVAWEDDDSRRGRQGQAELG